MATSKRKGQGHRFSHSLSWLPFLKNAGHSNISQPISTQSIRRGNDIVEVVTKLLNHVAQLKAILFDLDGTLVDTMQCYADIAEDVISRRYGISPEEARRLYLKTSGLPFFQQLDVVFSSHGENAAAAAEYEERKASVSLTAAMSDSTSNSLKKLVSAGIRLGISSNNFQAYVDQFALRSAVPFDLAMGYYRDMGKGCYHFERALNHFQCFPSELLFVGDSISDAIIAEAAGVEFVALLGTFAKADFEALWPRMLCVADIASLTKRICHAIGNVASHSM